MKKERRRMRRTLVLAASIPLVSAWLSAPAVALARQNDATASWNGSYGSGAPIGVTTSAVDRPLPEPDVRSS